MTALHVNPIMRCDKCGVLTADYECREYGRDAEGYADEEIICSECAHPFLAVELGPREVAQIAEDTNDCPF